VIYAAMVVLSLTTFWSVRRGLRHFADRARAIRERGRAAGRFGEQDAMPELREVAEEFDRMVAVLHNSAEDIRRAAEDNAHAFKTPIAVIRQSLEPLRRSLSADNQRGARALGLIESSLDRLDGLVASARRLEHATADLIDTTRADIDLSRVLERLLAAHVDVLAERGLVFRGSIAPGILVRAEEEMVETVIENLLDTAISFSPEGESIGVRLEARGDGAELIVADAGTGVAPENLERIFDRYFSHRPPGKSVDEHNATHFGIGLWVARRNVEALGGTIEAENRRPRGLLMRVRLPLAQGSRLGAANAKIASGDD
jgi:two-component system sensor histidine kinase ChvG